MVQSEGERLSWRPPERLGAIPWIERHYQTPPKINAYPGPYRFSRAPYMRGIAEAVENPSIEEIVLLKPVQVGFSELLRAIMAFWIDQKPGPTLYIMPSQQAVEELMDERIKPVVRTCYQVGRHLLPGKENLTNSFIRFDSMELYTGYAGSVQSLATRPIRYVLMDEVDNWGSNKDFAEPVKLARARTTTYGHQNSKIIIGSTPSVRSRPIWRAFTECDDQRCFFIPCPHCGKYQRLTWSNLKFTPYTIDSNGKETTPLDLLPDHKAKASYVDNNESAFYECSSCKGRIREEDKNSILQQGKWVSGKLNTEGEWQQTHNVGEHPQSKKVGFWINALYSLIGNSFSKLAGEFLRAQNNSDALQYFKNNFLAEPFEELVSSIKSDDVKLLQQSAPPANIFPDWGVALILTADVMQGANSIYWVLRAWGPEFRSQLVSFGVATSLDALLPILNTPVPMLNGYVKHVDMAAVDCGYVPDKVYEFSRKDGRIRAVEGQKGTQPNGTIKVSFLKDIGVERWDINTQLFKDYRYSQQLNGVWQINDAVNNDYCQQIASEHKIFDKVAGKVVWKQISQGGRNHYLDCEVYSLAVAHKLGIGQISNTNLTVDSQAEEPQIVMAI